MGGLYKEKTLFLVDDDAINLVICKEILSDTYNVFTMDSVKSMMDMMRRIMPDLIILDVVMPDVGGYEAIKMLKSRKKHEDIPVIFLTSKQDSASEEEGFALGAADFITKPISPPVLLKRIEQCLILEEQKAELNDMELISQILDKQLEDKKRVHQTVSKYLNQHLIEDIFADRASVLARRHIAILFADIRGFTPITESLKSTPEIVVEILNEYLEIITACVLENGGSVDKFFGDSVMALFNGFESQDDYIFYAAKSALDMIKKSESFRTNMMERIGVDLACGIGIHCGEVIVGNIGSAYRKDYTAIGDAVNVASRLEGRAGKAEILISKEMYDHLDGRIVASTVGRVLLKGKNVPIELFTLKGIV